jgi:6-phosphogluconolactonase (cycloisomerase 2 family)
MSNSQRTGVAGVRAAAIAVTLAITACGGGGGGGGSSTPPPPPPATTYSIGGTVSGLGNGVSVVLLDNGGDSVTVSDNKAFTFPTKLSSGATYAVIVGTQPTGQSCTVASGSGTATANVTNVAVTCTTTAPNTFTIGGTVTGLTASNLVLQDNGGDDLPVTKAATTFTFKTALATGKTYAVTVKTQPTGLTCTVTGGDDGHGNGTTGSANVTTVVVTCAATVTGPTQHVYITNKTDQTSGSISSFSIDPTTGKLTAVTGSPFAVAIQPRAITVDSAGRLYVAGAAAPVSGQQIGVIATTAAGALTLPATFFDPNGHAQTSAFSLLFNTDQSVLVATGANTNPAGAGGALGAAATFTNTAGVLAQLASNANAPPNDELDINFSPQQSALDPTGSFLLVPESDHTKLDALWLDATDTTDGALNKYAANQTTVPGNTHVWGVTFWPKGTATKGFAYASLENGQVAAYSYTNTSIAAWQADNTGATSPLTLIGAPSDAGCSTAGLAIDPTGKWLAVANTTGTPAAGGNCSTSTGGSVSWYTIDQTTGALTSGGPDVILTGNTATPGPTRLQWDSTGKFLYVVNTTEGSVSVLKLTGTTLSFDSTVASGAGADGLAIH